MWLQHNYHPTMLVKQIGPNLAYGWNAKGEYDEQMFIYPKRYTPITIQAIIDKCEELAMYQQTLIFDLEINGFKDIIPIVNKYCSHKSVIRSAELLLQCHYVQHQEGEFDNTKIWRRMIEQEIPMRARKTHARIWKNNLRCLLYDFTPSKSEMLNGTEIAVAVSDPYYMFKYFGNDLKTQQEKANKSLWGRIKRLIFSAK